MEFEKGVKAHIRLFDDLLAHIGKPPIFENPDFTFNSESSNAYAAIFDVASESRQNTVTMWLHLMGDGIRLDLDYIPEFFEWSDKRINEARQEVIDFLFHVFTGFILIEGEGGRRFVEIYDSTGQFVDLRSRNKLIHMIAGLRVSRNDASRRLFMPFYE